jgi:hypothetical protein
MRNGVRRITQAFVENWTTERIGEDVFQPRINFIVPPPSQTANGLTPATAVTGEFNALPNIFTIAVQRRRGPISRPWQLSKPATK